MSSSLRGYLNTVGDTLRAALCTLDVGSSLVERQTRPEVETREMAPVARCRTLEIRRDIHERCRIEVTVNSVRASFCVRKKTLMAGETGSSKNDKTSSYMPHFSQLNNGKQDSLVRRNSARGSNSFDLERSLIVEKFTRFLRQRASTSLDVLRKEPLPGYDLCFVFTANSEAYHVEGSEICVLGENGSLPDSWGVTNALFDQPFDQPLEGDADSSIQNPTLRDVFGLKKEVSPAMLRALRKDAASAGWGSLKTASREKVVDFLLEFLEDFERDTKDVRLSLNSQLRNAATEFLTALQT